MSTGKVSREDRRRCITFQIYIIPHHQIKPCHLRYKTTARMVYSNEAICELWKCCYSFVSRVSRFALSFYSTSHSFLLDLFPYIRLDCIFLCATQFSPQFRATKTEVSIRCFLYVLFIVWHVPSHDCSRCSCSRSGSSRNRKVVMNYIQMGKGTKWLHHLSIWYSPIELPAVWRRSRHLWQWNWNWHVDQNQPGDRLDWYKHSPCHPRKQHSLPRSLPLRVQTVAAARAFK